MDYGHTYEERHEVIYPTHHYNAAPPTIFSIEGHPMQYINYLPYYDGATGVDCDLCNTPIDVPSGFYHTDIGGGSDYCFNCGS